VQRHMLLRPPSPPAACIGLFIDVGANSGSSLHSWYEQEGCEDLKVRMGEAWPGIKRSACAWEWPPWLPLNLRRRYCAEAFEPNPRFSQRLLETARRLEHAHGVSIAVYNGTAFSTTTGSALLRLDRTKGGLGSSLLLRKPDTAQWGDVAPVRTVDGVAHLDMLPAEVGPLALKLDVEGAEANVLRNMLLSGVLCRRVHNLWVEWHSAALLGADNVRDVPPVAGVPSRPSLTTIHAVYRWMLQSYSGGARQNASGVYGRRARQGEHSGQHGGGRTSQLKPSSQDVKPHGRLWDAMWDGLRTPLAHRDCCTTLLEWS